MATVFPVLRWGKLAQAALVSGSRGRVLAATSRAAYLMTANEELLWLADQRSTPHRRFLTVAGAFPELTTGASFSVHDGFLRMNTGLTFELSGASVWRSSPRGRSTGFTRSSLRAALSTADASLRRLPMPVGLGVLLPTILARADRRPVATAITDSPVAARAWPVIQDVIDSGQEGDLRSSLVRCEELIGLGEGLTPSGDDFVGGFVYCLARLGQIHHGTPIECLLQKTRPRTNVISYTLLADHGRGHASAALQDFVDALITEPDPGPIERRAYQLIRLGHSTGWDLLTGVAVGLAVAPNLYGVRPRVAPCSTPAELG